MVDNEYVGRCRIEVRFAHSPYRKDGPVQQLDGGRVAHIAIYAFRAEDKLVSYAPRLPLIVSQASPYPIGRPTIAIDAEYAATLQQQEMGRMA